MYTYRINWGVSGIGGESQNNVLDTMENEDLQLCLWRCLDSVTNPENRVKSAVAECTRNMKWDESDIREEFDISVLPLSKTRYNVLISQINRICSYGIRHINWSKYFVYGHDENKLFLVYIPSFTYSILECEMIYLDRAFQWGREWLLAMLLIF